MPRNAASTYSAVETSGPAASCEHGWEFGCDDGIGCANFAIGAIKSGADEEITGVSVGGAKPTVTGIPEWTPIPVTVTDDPSVVCRMDFIRSR